MKKISALILAALLACSAASAQNPKTSADTVKMTDVVKTEAVDSIVASQAFSETDYLVDGEAIEAPSVSVRDGKWSLAYDGDDYFISQLVEDSRFAERFRDLEDFDADTLILKDNMGMATAIVAIIFGMPCLTIIVGLIVILAFALKRNRGRNELINNAIDHNYQLPDAFYMGQKNTTPGAPTRDSRKFYSATTLIAIGLSLVIFAVYSDASFFVLAGGIPFLIGVGQLIGYFCVPVTPRNNPMPPYGGGPFYGPNQPHRPWQPAPGQFPGAQQQQPYAAGPAPCQPSSPMPEAPSPLSPEVPAQDQCAPEYPANEGRQTPPPYNPS